MAYDLQTLITWRLLDCKLANHKFPDTLGDHLDTIESKLAVIEDLVTTNTVLVDAAKTQHMLEELTKQVKEQQASIDLLVTFVQKVQNQPLPAPE